MTKIRSKFFLQEQMTYQNAQFRNFGNDEGDILNFFNDHLRNLVSKNGGDNTFSSFSEEFHDKDLPIEKLSEKTRILLTHSNHTISQIEKGFISMIVEFDVALANELESLDHYYDELLDDDENFVGYSRRDLGQINQIFVGFKDAVEIIDEARFFVDGKLVSNYHQTEMIRESFAYNSIRSQESKLNSPHSHSLWENVINMSPNVCGVYIPIELLTWDLGQKAYVHVELELIIPFTDQLALQAWRLYPNRILGEIEEEVRFCLDGLVWCQVPPKNVGKISNNRQHFDLYEYNAPDLPITNHFIQINQPGFIVGGIKTGSNDSLIDTNVSFRTWSSIPYDMDEYNEEDLTNLPNMNFVTMLLTQNTLEYNPRSVKIREGRSNLFGFGIKPNVLESLMTTFQEPLIVPAQELRRVIFDQPITEKGIYVSKSMPLVNATNITMMFPTSPFDYTVYRNIMHKNVQLIIDKKLYPQKEFENTWDGRFVQYQLMANELDGIEATPEYLESISQPINDPINTIRYENSRYDDTNFGINFQLERGNSGYVFDGVDTDNHEVWIRFKADAIATDYENSYYYPEVNASHEIKGHIINTAHPEMWICSDTYWTWSIQDGVQYHDDGVPSGYK